MKRLGRDGRPPFSHTQLGCRNVSNMASQAVSSPGDLLRARTDAFGREPHVPAAISLGASTRVLVFAPNLDVVVGEADRLPSDGLRGELYPGDGAGRCPETGPDGEKRMFHSLRHTFAKRGAREWRADHAREPLS